MTTRITILLKEALIRSDNDENIADIIMSYITIECDGCECMELLKDITEVECNCSANTDLDKCKQDYYFCDMCMDEKCCYSCNDYYCPNANDEGYELRKCDDENCDRGFCDDCYGNSMLYCSVCEEWFCCRGVRRHIDSSLEYFYTCDICNKIENCEYFGARH